MELKTTSVLKKDKLVKKLKAIFGEGTTKGDEDDDEEEDGEEVEQDQGPLALTQGIQEYIEKESVKEEQANEEPTKPHPKKRKVRKKLDAKPKKATKPSLAKPTTRGSTRVITQKAKE